MKAHLSGPKSDNDLHPVHRKRPLPVADASLSAHPQVPRLDASLDAVMAEREQGGEQLRSKGRPRGGDSGLSLDDEVGMRLESELLALGGSGGRGWAISGSQKEASRLERGRDGCLIRVGSWLGSPRILLLAARASGDP